MRAHARRVALVGAALAATGAAVVALPSPAAAAGAGLPVVATGHRPGPDILYAPLAQAPQLSNAGIWTAPPILVSGASAYRGGEYLYQDFLYDDHGANGGVADQNDPRRSPGGQSSSGDLFALPAGTYTYPTDARYANNAADIVEVRIRPLAGATAIRITVNTLIDPSLVGFSIALGTGSAAAVPHGANATAAAKHVVTVHGTTADLDGAVPPSPISVSVDLPRRQFEVRVPPADWTPGSTEHISLGAGLWDAANDRFLIPTQNATSTAPGGAGTLSTPPAYFNVAFRHDEPLPVVGDLTNTAVPKWWRDRGQALALNGGDLTHYGDVIDFTKLATAVNDDMHGLPQGVPTTGALDRIMASHFENGQGADYSTACASSTSCKGELRGQLQPYAIYVPPAGPPGGGFGLTLLPHSLSANYNQYLGSRNQSQLGDRAPGYIVITGTGRGTDSWYYDVGGADAFEVWADAAAHYPLNPDLTDISGYSMGGYATYKFASQFPDLFARAQPVVGPPGLGIWVPPAPPQPGGNQSNTNLMLASVRNIPFLIWNASADELVPVPGPIAQSQTFDSLGYRYIFDLFAPAEHLTLAFNDQFQPAADFLGHDPVDRNPPHVSYVRNPSMDFPQDGTTADHAYWLSSIAVRDARAQNGMGTIDVRSEGFGVGDPTPSGTQVGGGVLTGGTLPGIAYAERSQTWSPPPPAPVADRLDVSAINVSTVTVDPVRARVDCNVDVHVVQTDGPLTVVLAGCARTVVAGVPTTAAGPSNLPNTGTRPVASWPGWAALALLSGATWRRRRRTG